MSANQQLLQDVRRVATEHEARRSAILNELQSLSARMGALQMSREPFTALTEEPVDLPLGDALQLARRGGDWRQVVANVEVPSRGRGLNRNIVRQALQSDADNR